MVRALLKKIPVLPAGAAIAALAAVSILGAVTFASSRPTTASAQAIYYPITYPNGYSYFNQLLPSFSNGNFWGSSPAYYSSGYGYEPVSVYGNSYYSSPSYSYPSYSSYAPSYSTGNTVTITIYR